MFPKWHKVSIFMAVCLFAGLLRVSLLNYSLSWYSMLSKPALSPPLWVYGPLWLIVYVLMGIAAYMVWETVKEGPKVDYAKAAFSWQLALNVCWPILFFGVRSKLGGLLIIIPLWLTLIATTVLFFKRSKHAGLLLVPALAFVSLAVILNIYVVQLN